MTDIKLNHVFFTAGFCALVGVVKRGKASRVYRRYSPEEACKKAGL